MKSIRSMILSIGATAMVKVDEIVHYRKMLTKDLWHKLLELYTTTNARQS